MPADGMIDQRLLASFTAFNSEKVSETINLATGNSATKHSDASQPLNARDKKHRPRRQSQGHKIIAGKGNEEASKQERV